MKFFLLISILFTIGCTSHSIIHVPTSKVGYLTTTFCNQYLFGILNGDEYFIANILSDKSIDEITMIEERKNYFLFPLYYSKCYVITGNATMEPGERVEYQKKMIDRTNEFKKKLP